MSRLDNLLSYENPAKIRTDTLTVRSPWISSNNFMSKQMHYYINFEDEAIPLSQDDILAVVFSLMSCEPLLL